MLLAESKPLKTHREQHFDNKLTFYKKLYEGED